MAQSIHVSCTPEDKQRILKLLNELKALGVRQLVLQNLQAWGHAGSGDTGIFALQFDSEDDRIFFNYYRDESKDLDHRLARLWQNVSRVTRVVDGSWKVKRPIRMGFKLPISVKGRLWAKQK